MLSGFVLTHVHARELDDGVDRRTYGRFLLLRLARVYPLHLLALLAIVPVRHLAQQTDGNAGAFLMQLWLMASWGFNGGLSWNGPAWSLSAEWFAYLVFPLIVTCTAGLRGARAALLALAGVFFVFVCIFFSHYLFGIFQFITDYSNGPGALARVIVGVALGSVFRRLYDFPSVRRLTWGIVFWLAVPLAVAFMTDRHGVRLDNNPGAFGAVMFLAFAAICANPRALPPFTTRAPVYLGEISYALFISHYPLVLFLKRLAGPQLDALADASPAGGPLVLALGTGVALLVAAALHHGVEDPVRRRARLWIDARYPLPSREPPFAPAAPAAR
jgi:peptidoglycan/LPS O-acetylase OafA/YrhL